MSAPTVSAATAEPVGLTEAEARRRLQQVGPNAVSDEAIPLWRSGLEKFWSPVPWMLEAVIAVQIALGERVEAVVIGGLLVFNAALGLIQEGRASAALALLRKGLAPTATVRRGGEWVRRPAAELVPGDVIALPLGAMVPADARIVSGAVTVDQSTLTGESVPVERGSGGQVYAGSLVRRGQAVAEVTATGARTYFGRTAELVRTAHAESSEQSAIFATTRNLAVVNGLVALGIVGYAYAAGLPAGEVIRLALTALLASIPVALPATFTLSAALGAQTLAQRGVLLTRLSAAHEAASMDVLCADKTGTLTRNELEVVEATAMPGSDRDRVLRLAALASSDADQDPIDAAIRVAAASAARQPPSARRTRFVPFDPATRISEAIIVDESGSELRVLKGAFAAIAGLAEVPPDARRAVDDLAERGHRVIAVAAGPTASPALIGLIAISDPPREDSAELVSTLRQLGVRTVMITGDSPVTAAAIARKVGIAGAVCPADQLSSALAADQFGVFARVVPEDKFRLVQALQQAGHVVGMCGDGTNDAPALRQAQIGIAVSSATDIAKAAAGMVMTQPGLGGIVFAVREGRAGLQRLLTYTFNMLVKKFEIVLFLAFGLGLTGQAVMTPVLMVLLIVTNDFLSMSLTTDRASPLAGPAAWRMRRVTAAAVALAMCKLGFSATILALGKVRLGLGQAELQTLAFAALVFGNQAVLYTLRERRRMWSSKPGAWVVASSAVDIAIVTLLASSGILMEALPFKLLVALLIAAAGFAVVLDRIKLAVISVFGLA